MTKYEIYLIIIDINLIFTVTEMTKHKKIKLNMRATLLCDLLFAYFCGNAPTRSSVSESCNVSKATAGKVANALVQSNIMCERTFSLNGASPCAHLFIDDDVNTMVIDLSSPTFKLTLFDPDALVRFQAIHDYDTSVSFDDNMNIFLSRCGLKAKQSGHTFSAITVVYADGVRRTYPENADTRVIPPSIETRDRIGEYIYSVFHKHPISHLTVSSAISEAMRFGVTNKIKGNEGVSYIFIGSRVSSFHVYANGSITVCSPQNMLLESEKQTLAKRRSVSKDEIDSIFVRLARFMDSAFSPSTILLESDFQLPDDQTARKLDREFILSGTTPPVIRFKNNDAPLYILGAIRSSLFALAQKYIIP